MHAAAGTGDDGGFSVGWAINRTVWDTATALRCGHILFAEHVADDTAYPGNPFDCAAGGLCFIRTRAGNGESGDCQQRGCGHASVAGGRGGGDRFHARQVGAALGVAIAGTVVSTSRAKGSSFTLATHPIWWIMAACGAIVLFLGCASATAWASKSADLVAAEL